jgi:hypothetical protein
MTRHAINMLSLYLTHLPDRPSSLPQALKVQQHGP